jgi:hypothetical protein
MSKKELLVRGKLKLDGVVENENPPDDVLRHVERRRKSRAQRVAVDRNDIDRDVSEAENDDRPGREVLPLLESRLFGVIPRHFCSPRVRERWDDGTQRNEIPTVGSCEVKGSPKEVAVVGRRKVANWLDRRPTQLSADRIESICSVARLRSTWATIGSRAVGTGAPSSDKSDH